MTCPSPRPPLFALAAALGLGLSLTEAIRPAGVTASWVLSVWHFFLPE